MHTQPGDSHRRGFLRGTILSAAGCLAARPLLADPAPPKQPAVLELFTSQGCNSCPPADRVLADLVNKHEQNRYPVLGLSFHVDYWNYLGWSDPFSSPRWSARQRLYAKVLDDRVYTPQAIVNGRDAMVGSRRRQLEAVLPEHWQRLANHSIKLQHTVKEKREVIVEYAVQGDLADHVVNVALVARSLMATAKGGENAGRTLTHANVVRDFATERLSDDRGNVSLRLPADDDSQHALIAYVQHIQNATISGASEQAIQS